MKITLSLPPTLAARVQRHADKRGVPVEAYAITLLDWNSPAYDNDAQYLKEQVKKVLLSEVVGDKFAVLDAVAALVGA